MDFVVKINCDNEAFEYTPEHCVADILENISVEVVSGKVFGNVRDTNGAVVGKWEFTDI